MRQKKDIIKTITYFLFLYICYYEILFKLYRLVVKLKFSFSERLYFVFGPGYRIISFFFLSFFIGGIILLIFKNRYFYIQHIIFGISFYISYYLPWLGYPNREWYLALYEIFWILFSIVIGTYIIPFIKYISYVFGKKSKLKKNWEEKPS